MILSTQIWNSYLDARQPPSGNAFCESARSDSVPPLYRHCRLRDGTIEPRKRRKKTVRSRSNLEVLSSPFLPITF
jgi:hypothetical protein